jgi:hypothetical protein
MFVAALCYIALTRSSVIVCKDSQTDSVTSLTHSIARRRPTYVSARMCLTCHSSHISFVLHPAYKLLKRKFRALETERSSASLLTDMLRVTSASIADVQGWHKQLVAATLTKRTSASAVDGGFVMLAHRCCDLTILFVCPDRSKYYDTLIRQHELSKFMANRAVSTSTPVLTESLLALESQLSRLEESLSISKLSVTDVHTVYYIRHSCRVLTLVTLPLRW